MSAIEIQALAVPAVPAYHMRMKDLVAAQKVEYLACARTNPPGLFELWHDHSFQRAVLRQAHADARARVKAEKALVAESKLEPAFWRDCPNHDGRRDTLTAVLKTMGVCTDYVTDLMPVYAKWLLTAKKTHANGRPMNRWALMEAFATEGDY
jgi:hypothetical protein